MGKKVAKKKTVVDTSDKARMELRFDMDLAEKTKALAEKAGISVNQLLSGLARWAVKALQEGEPVYDAKGRVSVRKQLGCLWAGRTAGFEKMSMQEIEEEVNGRGYPPEDEEDFFKPDETKYGNGEVYIFLDFTERRVVRDDVDRM